jgi:hypothetical protein
VVSSTPRPQFTPGKDPVPIVQEAGWAAGPVWKGRKSRPHRDSKDGDNGDKNNNEEESGIEIKTREIGLYF